jgi:hypothetical protein
MTLVFGEMENLQAFDSLGDFFLVLDKPDQFKQALSYFGPGGLKKKNIEHRTSNTES